MQEKKEFQLRMEPLLDPAMFLFTSFVLNSHWSRARYSKSSQQSVYFRSFYVLRVFWPDARWPTIEHIHPSFAIFLIRSTDYNFYKNRSISWKYIWGCSLSSYVIICYLMDKQFLFQLNTKFKMKKVFNFAKNSEYLLITALLTK